MVPAAGAAPGRQGLEPASGQAPDSAAPREVAHWRFMGRPAAVEAGASAWAGLRERAVRAGTQVQEAAAPLKTRRSGETGGGAATNSGAEPPLVGRLLDLPRLGAARAPRVLDTTWPRLLEQVQGRLELLRLGQGTSAELALEPEELGSLRLLLSQGEGGWRLEIHAGVEATATELQRRAQDLHDQLARAGIRLEELRLFSEGPARAAAPEAPRQLDPERARDGAEESDSGRDDARRRQPSGQERPGQPSAAEDFASRLDRLLKGA